MIRVMAMTKQQELLKDLKLADLETLDKEWYWVDFDNPDEYEIQLLDSYFHFHPLAIEDCLHLLQRPKVDHYGDIHFFVLHSIDPGTLHVNEVNVFLGPDFAVTFHFHPSFEIDDAWKHCPFPAEHAARGHLFAVYFVMDKLVDQYFPAVYELEDTLLDMEIGSGHLASQTDMNDIFNIRSRLLRLRKTVVPMRDLLYRIISMGEIPGMKELAAFFHDVYDHLLKQSETIEASREMTADLRDSFMSYNSNRMNLIMKTLTVITTIFMPLTFIAGIYGMNFVNMPELQWQWGYFAVLGVMLLVGFSMYAWFRRKGWFE
ncbi:magnesium/cobalt transporter CorA [Paenibacillus beijingensis]|uniref:Magnesium transport protein CorA n=1 Tax=Paenibacillus beijingensis TaxID=1126833 RepID=A0A0D5NP48_9BACL|nr:magnesium/cobalt transporter CorA [Paenibacillus beijingensis]AJY76668.1 metal transporter [Paenibacillus beijingensis]